MKRLCYGSFATVLYHCRKKGVYQKEINENLLYFVNPHSSMRHESQASRLFNCLIGLSDHDVINPARNIDIHELASHFESDVITPLIDQSKAKWAVLALLDIIDGDKEILEDTVIERHGCFSKAQLYEMDKKFVLPNFLAGLFLYLITSVDNREGSLSIKEITKKYVESFKDKAATINIVNDVGFDASSESALIFSDKFNSVLFGESRFTNKARMCDVYVEPVFLREKKNDCFENFYNELKSGLGFIIEGDAGIGKSSFITHLASRYISEGSASLFQNKKVYFVQGKDIRNSCGNVVDDISKALKINADKLLSLENAVLMIDAYDEISYASMNKENNVQYFSSLVSNFSHLFLIVTSRGGYVSGKMLPKIQMLSFTPEQIRIYLEKYNSVRLEQERLSVGLINSLVTPVDEYLTDVVSIPLFLYMIITNDVDVSALEDIYDLYERIFYKNEDTIYSTLSARSGDAKDIRLTSVSVS